MEDIIRQKAMEYNISPLHDNPVIAMASVPYHECSKTLWCRARNFKWNYVSLLRQALLPEL